MAYDVVQRVVPPLKLGKKAPKQPREPEAKMLNGAPRNKDAGKQRRHK